MRVGMAIAIITLLASVAIYMGYTIGEINEMRKALERIERRLQPRKRKRRRDIEMLPYED